MAKKIGILMFALSIIIAGITAFDRLHYREKSMRILSADKEQSFKREGNRNRGDVNRDERQWRSEIQDRQNFRNSHPDNRGNQFDEGRTLFLPDSLNQTENNRTVRRSFREQDFKRNKHLHGDSRRNSSIHLENTGWFLAVFAMFTVVTIYIEKIFNSIRSVFFRK